MRNILQYICGIAEYEYEAFESKDDRSIVDYRTSNIKFSTFRPSKRHSA